MPKYAIDLKTGLILGGIVDSAAEANPETQYFLEGVLTDRPLLLTVDAVWDNSLPINGGGSVKEGTGVLYIRNGDYVSISGLEDYTGAVITSPWGNIVTDGVNNEFGWSTPMSDGTYTIEVHYLAYRVARLKVIAKHDFPHPNQ